MQKALTQMNLLLHNVVSDITGVTGMRIIKAILDGEQDAPMVVLSDMSLPDGNALDLLERRRAQGAGQEWIFLTGYGTGFNPDALGRLITGYFQRAGFTRKGSCHLLRHTCATHMLEGGADIRYIQQLLGHANLDTTAIYTQVGIHQLQAVHARCHPAERPGKQTSADRVAAPADEPQTAANAAEASSL